MTISANIEWEIRVNGAATNGGGFTTGASGTDYSEQDAAHATRTDIVIDGTTDTDITSSADAFAADDVGNLINITSGTGFTTGRYEIISIAAGVATLDRAVGTLSSTGGNGTLGGAVTFLDAIFEQGEPGNIFHIKNDGTHTLTALINMSQSGTNTLPINFIGFNSTRGDTPTGTNRPLIAAGANDTTFNDFISIRNIRITTTNGNGLQLDNNCLVENVKSENTSGTAGRRAIYINSDSVVMNCEAISTNGVGVLFFVDSAIINSYLHDSVNGAKNGFSTHGDLTFANNIIDTCTTGLDLISGISNMITNNTFYNCTTGILGNATFSNCFVNNIIDNCTTGANWTGGNFKSNYWDFNNWSNNTADVINVTKGSNTTALDPQFLDAVNGDFSVGTNMKATSAPTAGIAISHLDQGAVQRQEPASGAAAGYNVAIG